MCWRSELARELPRVDQVAVARGRLAVDDRELVGRRQEVVGEHPELVDRDGAVELAVGGVVKEVEPSLEDVGLVGPLADGRQGRAGADRRPAGPAEQAGHGAGLGQADRRGLVDEVLDLLGGDEAVLVGVDQVESPLAKQVVQGLLALDGGDRVADIDPRVFAEMGAADEGRHDDAGSSVVGSSVTGTAVHWRMALTPSGLP